MAMTEKRPDQVSKSEADAVNELWRCAGTQFDKAYVQEFMLWRSTR